FFFFQAEVGIRDFHVTGVQTCALPIFKEQAEKGAQSKENDKPSDTKTQKRSFEEFRRSRTKWGQKGVKEYIEPRYKKLRKEQERSEERRVGKEWRRW